MRVISTIKDKALLVETVNPDAIVSAVRKSEKLDTDKAVVFWDMENARKLTSMGVAETPSPIHRDYEWTGKLKPFAHQKETSAFFTLHKRAFCFNEQGTGKTGSVIWASDYLMKLKLVKRVLVICPLSIMRSAWQQDIFKFAMHRNCVIAHGDSKTRKKLVSQKSDFTIINFDGVGVAKEEILNGGFDLIVVDEANSYKNAQTNRWKILKFILDKTDPHLWMLTGTPASQSPLDAYGLAKLVNPDGVPRFFGQFRDKVMFKVSQFKWVPKPTAKDYVFEVLQPAIRFERSQCLDLPDVTFLEREAPMTAQQTQVYKKLKTQLYLEADGEAISAVNAAVKINKLLQIAGGSVYSDSGEVIDMDVSNRLNVVMEVIEEASHKVLVFVPFTHTIELLRGHLESYGISCGVINGQVTVNKRTDLVAKFQTTPDPQVLIIQPQAASHGLTLTAADTIIWYAPVTSVETYLQANARINRPGQKNAMTIVHIRGSDVEAKLYHMLQNNIMTHTEIIDLYKREIETT